MANEQDVAGDETRAESCRAGGRDWRRGARGWWDQAETWDPERWKAMAAAWANKWQNVATAPPDEPGAASSTKTCPYCAEEIKRAAIKCKHCSTWLSHPGGSFWNAFASHPPTGQPASGPPARLTRSRDDLMAAGVLGGLGRFLGVDATWLRIAYALATFFTAFLPGLLIYAMLAIIIPTDAPGKCHIPE